MKLRIIIFGICQIFLDKKIIDYKFRVEHSEMATNGDNEADRDVESVFTPILSPPQN